MTSGFWGIVAITALTAANKRLELGIDDSVLMSLVAAWGIYFGGRTYRGAKYDADQAKAKE